MLKRLIYSFFICGTVLYSLPGCDKIPGNPAADTAGSVVSDFTVTPDVLVFDPAADGQKDTVIVFKATVKAEGLPPGDAPYLYVFVTDNRDNDPDYTLEFSALEGCSNCYEAEFELKTKTFAFAVYKLLITPEVVENHPGNYIQTEIRQTGVAVHPPVILETNAPVTVIIPEDNSVVNIPFTAKVTDPDGQDNIDHVFLNFREPDGTLLSAEPFVMLDDGKIESSGDAVAGDSVYTKVLSVDKSNTPRNRTALYWAVDKAGLSSDTLEVPFNIVKE